MLKARIRLNIEIEIGLEFNQSKERKPISSLVNSALIGQNLITFNAECDLGCIPFNVCNACVHHFIFIV